MAESTFWTIVVCHGRQDQSLLAFNAKDRADAAFNRLSAGILSATKEPGTVTDDYECSLALAGVSITALRMVGNIGGRNLQIFGAIEDARKNTALTDRAALEFGAKNVRTVLPNRRPS